MKDIEEIVEAWTRLDEKLNMLIEENRKLAMEIKKNQYKSCQEKLIDKYRLFIILEGLCMIAFPLMILYNPLVVEKYRYATLVYWFLFFAIEFCLDLYLLCKLQGIDIYESPVSEISKRAANNWKIHKIGVICSFPLAIGAVILFGFSMGKSEGLITGMCVGGLIGLLIGFNELRKFRKNYKKLQSEN